MTPTYLEIDTPVGPLTAVAGDDALVGIYMVEHKGAPGRDGWQPARPGRRHRVLDLARRQLDEYFAGRRRDFDLPLAPVGTPFEVRVWEELRRIGYGETVSYGQVAARIGRPLASRAVGRANGRNPISIVVPCHRVVGSSGRLTGYAGGLDRKQWLLQHERAHTGT